MKPVVVGLSILALLILSGCSKTAADCGGADALATVIPLVQHKLEEKTSERLRSSDGSPPASLSRVRATVAQAAMRIEDVRTTQSDPNSTRRFCMGRLKVVIPAAVLQEADRGRQAAGANTVSQLADSSRIERDADAFVADIEYSVQPTDDGTHIYAEIENSDGYINYFAEVLASYLLRPVVEQARLEQERAAAAQQQAQEQQQRAQDAAVAEQRGAILDQARSENRLVVQTINAVWGNIPKETRDQLLDMQRAWIRRKHADCQIESASASTDPQEQEAARLRCDTRVTNERINYLRQYSTG
jgi:uncharacterized protein YecT (DUF1311 family)